MNYSTQTEQSIDIDDVSKGIEIMKIKKPRQPRQKKNKEVKIDIAGGVKQNDTTNQIKDIIFQEELKELEKTVEENVKNKIGELDIEKTILSHLGNYIEEPYHIIESYFQGQHLERLVRHQIESYNHFVNYQIQRTIQMFNPVTVHSDNDYIENENKYLLEILISFTNFKLYPPQIH
jgi:hypothetical protein